MGLVFSFFLGHLGDQSRWLGVDRELLKGVLSALTIAT